MDWFFKMHKLVQPKSLLNIYKGWAENTIDVDSIAGCSFFLYRECANACSTIQWQPGFHESTPDLITQTIVCVGNLANNMKE